jgi:hypothetical protein
MEKIVYKNKNYRIVEIFNKEKLETKYRIDKSFLFWFWDKKIKLIKTYKYDTGKRNIYDELLFNTFESAKNYVEISLNLIDNDLDNDKLDINIFINQQEVNKFCSFDDYENLLDTLNKFDIQFIKN